MGMKEVKKANMSGDEAARCLLLVPRGYDAPLALLEGLRRRGVSVREVSDGIGVMMELGLDGRGMLVIVEPGAVRDVNRIVGAVRRYYSRVVCWQYSYGIDRPLVRYRFDEGSDEKSEGIDEVDEVVCDEGEREAGGLTIHIDGDAIDRFVDNRLGLGDEASEDGGWGGGLSIAGGDDEVGSGEEVEFDGGPLITEEELSMLLGGEEGGEKSGEELGEEEK